MGKEKKKNKDCSTCSHNGFCNICWHFAIDDIGPHISKAWKDCKGKHWRDPRHD